MTQEIKNRNFLTPLKFDFSVDRLPNTNFFTQSVAIPGISLPHASNVEGTPFSNIPWQGDRIDFSDLVVDFKVDENLRNWYEVFKWMNGIGTPQSFNQYKDLKEGQDTNLDGEKRSPLPPATKLGHIYGQATLIVRSSTQRPILSIHFKDVHPTGLSEVKFDTTDENITEITCSVTFKYDYYTVELP